MGLTSARTRRFTALLTASVLALVGLFGLVGVTAADAAEHPDLDVTEVNMVPERGWGVSGQNPSTTQTETLDVLVWDMVQSGDNMFVAGAFLYVQNGKDASRISQPYLAAFDVVTGEWNSSFRPQFDRAIYALDVLPNGSVLVGGEFENVNGTTRRGLVALDEVTGEIDPTFAGAVDRPWSSRRATIRDIEVESASGRIYVAGNFSHLDGAGGSRTTVSKAGRFSNDRGVIDATWKPTVSGGAVWGLDTDPSRGEVAMSGWFTSINGRSGTGHFEVVDDQTGAYVPGKQELTKNDGGAQPETFDVVYGDGIVLMIGEQHMVQVLDADNHSLLGYHATGFADGFQWRGGFAGGAYQAGDRIGDVILIGCHCTSGGNNYYESFTGSRSSHYNLMAIDAITGRHIQGFNADIDSPRDGHWAAASDTNGCLWIGGDYHVGGNENGSPRWVGGFARLCTPIPPINIADPGDQIASLGDVVSIQIDAVGGRNATFNYSATGLPAGLAIDQATGLITGTADQVGFSTVTVTVVAVAGEGRTATQTFDWGVMDGQAPVLAPIDRRTVLSGRPTELELIATDTENSQLSWTATGLPAGLGIVADTGVISNAGQQGSAAPGTYAVTVTVTDIVGLSDSETFTLRVIEPPVIDAIASYTGYETNGGSWFLGWRFTVDEPTTISELGIYDADRNGQISNNGATTAALYSTANSQNLGQVDIPANAPIENGSAYAALANPVTVQPGITYVIAAEISGEPYGRYTGSLSTAPGINYVGGAYTWGSSPNYPNNFYNGPTNFMGGTFRIQGDVVAPTLAPIADRLTTTETVESVALTVDNPGGGTLTWTAAGLPGGLAINPGTGLITGTPNTPGVFSTVVTVTDEDDLADSEAFSWTVTDSVPPVLNSIGDQIVGQFDTIAIQTPVANNEAGLVWSATGLPAGTSIDPDTGTISGTVGRDGTFDVTVTVTDIVGLTDSETFTITIIGRSTTPAIASYSNFTSRSGTYFLGFQFQVDRQMDVAELGVFDADSNGQITNQGATTVALYTEADGQLIAQTNVPADAPIEEGFAYGPLDQLVTLNPGTTYVLASEVSGEAFAEGGNLTFAPGVTYAGYAWKNGADAGFPNNRGNQNANQYFGPTFRTVDTEPEVGEDLLIGARSNWRYDDSGVGQQGPWYSTQFDDAAWPSAAAEFGFGDGDEATVWEPGSVTYYARTEFEFTGDKPASLQLDLKADDGAVIYLNGVEVLRDNMPDGLITPTTSAIDWRSGPDENFSSHVVSSVPLLEGTNLIAVEVHNVWANNSDLSFDLRLLPSDDAGAELPIKLIANGSTWTHIDSAAGEPVDWKQGIVGGQLGDAEFGFGDDDETTLLTPGQDAYYFTRTFQVADLGEIDELTLGLAADDGAVVYLNGVEVHRFNMPAGPVTAETRPITWMAGDDERFKASSIAMDALVAGTNTIAVEVHNLWPGNSDVTFDLYLDG
ncbi:MAG: putative Ig domain-containing protein [Acidimicrobiales bacterium]